MPIMAITSSFLKSKLYTLIYWHTQVRATIVVLEMDTRQRAAMAKRSLQVWKVPVVSGGPSHMLVEG